MIYSSFSRSLVCFVSSRCTSNSIQFQTRLFQFFIPSYNGDRSVDFMSSVCSWSNRSLAIPVEFVAYFISFSYPIKPMNSVKSLPAPITSASTGRSVVYPTYLARPTTTKQVSLLSFVPLHPPVHSGGEILHTSPTLTSPTSPFFFPKATSRCSNSAYRGDQSFFSSFPPSVTALAPRIARILAFRFLMHSTAIVIPAMRISRPIMLPATISAITPLAKCCDVFAAGVGEGDWGEPMLVDGRVGGAMVVN